MRPIYRPLLVMHPGEEFRERVRRAANSEYHFLAIPSWELLEQAIREAPPAALVVVDPYAETDGALSPALRKILLEYPSVAILAATEVAPERAEHLKTLGRWGIVQVIALGHDDTLPGIAHRLRAARGRPLQALLEQALPPDVPGRARAIVDAATDVVAVGGHGRDLASSLDLSRRTLLRWCRRAGLPPPRKLLAWMRVLLAAALLDDPGRAVLTVAQVCGYSSDSGLRRITQKFLGKSPTELRQVGAFEYSSRRFLEVIEESRRSPTPAA